MVILNFKLFVLTNWEVLTLQGDPTSPFWRRSALGFLWKEWCWSWNSGTLATSCQMSWLIGKDSDAGRDWGQKEKGMTEDEMAGWHHWLDGRESEWTPGDGDGQGGLACCVSWGYKELDTAEWLNWTELNWESGNVICNKEVWISIMKQRLEGWDDPISPAQHLPQIITSGTSLIKVCFAVPLHPHVYTPS